MRGPELQASRSSESALLTRVAAGDRGAFARLYDQHAVSVHQFARRLTRSRELADEVLNDVMVATWRQAAQFRGSSRLSTWILGITYRTAMKALRRTTRISAQEVAECAVLPAEDSPDQGVLRQESQDATRRAIGELSPEHRAVVELTFFHELSYREISEVLGCPENTVKTRMFHARKRLRDMLANARVGGVPAQGANSP
ncbi:hypothetical protein ABI59_22815 [Acidobacteria bacterium Mor1]|nr:hypothetical protein ABI59_22815 [Acidobacteria bacterium Mor1]